MSKGQFRPLNDNVLVAVDTGDAFGEKKTESGLILKAEFEATVVVGQIVAVGYGKLSLDGSRSAMVTQVGDDAHFARANAVSMTLGGKKFYIVSETNLLGHVREVE